MSLVKGHDLKEIITSGLTDHQNHVTYTLKKVLLEFASSIRDDDHYDLFCCLAELVLVADEDAGPLIANLMQAADKELEVMDKDTCSNIGYFFTEHFKKKSILKYFRENAREKTEREAGVKSKFSPDNLEVDTVVNEEIPFEDDEPRANESLTLHAMKSRVRSDRRKRLESMLPQFTKRPELLDNLPYGDLLIMPGLLGYRQKPTSIGAKKDIVTWIKKSLKHGFKEKN